MVQTIPKSQWHNTMRTYFFSNTTHHSFFLTVAWLGPLAIIITQGLRLGEALCQHATAAKSLQSCPTPCNPIDGSPPGSTINMHFHYFCGEVITQCAHSHIFLIFVHFSWAKGDHMPSPNFTWVGKYSLSRSLKRGKNRSMYALAPFTTQDLNKLMESLGSRIVGSDVTTPLEGSTLMWLHFALRMLEENISEWFKVKHWCLWSHHKWGPIFALFLML